VRKPSAVVDFGGGTGFTYASANRYISQALKEQSIRFDALISELSAFKPKTFEMVLNETKLAFTAAKSLNTPEAWDAMVNEQSKLNVKPHTQVFLHFSDRLNACWINNVILSAALCEAAANTACAVHSVSIGQPDIFEMFERLELKTKWVSGMKLIFPAYVLDKSGPLYEALDQTVALRNSYMHHKISIWSSDEKTSLRGSKAPDISFDDAGISMMCRILKLPVDLVSNLVEQIDDPSRKFQFSVILT
jgi:hypothetical protein